MAIKLTIDEGNSSVKVALWRDGVMEDVATHRHATPQLLRGILPPGEAADCAIYCSVCGRTASEVAELTHDIARNVIMLDAYTSMPIAIDYRSRHTLGADRIAAAAGAVVLAPGRPALVVDMGTAITYDVVTADAHFAGGNIAPGIFVRLEALDHFTRALPLVETDGDVPRWGYDTSTAMRSGAIRGVVGELHYYRHCLSAECDTDPAIILTGGSAELILPFITTPIIYEPNLVLIGLNRILDYNEN
ncbi:MAG: type III pantothenate kinase [Muribaculaceae bacterium]|nr:type III pantothenate kinase [Muribaculaceae bacterium]